MNEAFIVPDHQLIKFVGMKHDEARQVRDQSSITQNLLYVSKFCEIAQWLNVVPIGRLRRRNTPRLMETQLLLLWGRAAAPAGQIGRDTGEQTKIEHQTGIS